MSDYSGHEHEGLTYGSGIVTHKKPDMVKHPPHYTSNPSGIECIQVTQHMNYCIGNAVKYLWRVDDKDDSIENLEKAKQYIDFEIERRKRG